MVKKLSFNHLFDRVNTTFPLDDQKDTKNPKLKTAHSEPLPHPISCNSEESVSKIDTVNSGHCQNLTVSNSDPVKKRLQDQKLTVSAADTVDPSHCQSVTPLNSDAVTQLQQGEKLTVSKNDTVMKRHCQSVTVSEIDPVESKDEKRRFQRGNFTAVPNALLRTEGTFHEPQDFMIYMHLLTYSHGFGRETVNMGQVQLARFTGATKNTVKKSLDRLVSQKLIQLVEEYEHSRVTRKWRVILPEAPSPGSDPKKREDSCSAPTVSKSDSVNFEHCQTLTQTLPKSDTVTGSKFHPYKESISKKVLKKSLSGARNENLNFDHLPDRLKRHFNQLAPRAKLESEWRAFLDLQSEFKLDEIEAAFTWLKRNGLPDTGKPAHSPMGFLRVGIGQIFHRVRKSGFSKIANDSPAVSPKLDFAANANFSMDLADLERRFPIQGERTSLIKKLTADIPGINPDGPFALHLAMSRLHNLNEVQSA